MSAISLKSVSKSFVTAKGPFQALDNVSLDIQPGEFVGLLGPNGAGKTTLISLLAGLSRPSQGSLHVMGLNVLSQGLEVRRVLGVVPQELVFDPFFNVREALRFQSGYFGLKRNDDWIDELLQGLGLSDKADTNMRQLSGGMKRRVMVAQALVHRPRAIILDEPTAGVDVELRQSLWRFISRLNKEGMTVLLTTHYLEEAEALCGRIALLKQGKLIANEKTTDLLARTQASVLRFQLEGDLPPSLLAQARITGRVVQIPVADAGAIEHTLRTLRESGAQAKHIEIRPADLEDVFLQLMGAST